MILLSVEEHVGLDEEGSKTIDALNTEVIESIDHLYGQRSDSVPARILCKPKYFDADANSERWPYVWRMLSIVSCVNASTVLLPSSSSHPCSSTLSKTIVSYSKSFLRPTHRPSCAGSDRCLRFRFQVRWRQVWKRRHP